MVIHKVIMKICLIYFLILGKKAYFGNVEEMGENPSILQYKHLIKTSTAQRNTLLLKEMNLLPFTRNGAYTNMVKSVKIVDSIVLIL